MIITKKIFSKTLTRPLGFPVFLFSVLFLLAATSRATAQTSPRPTDPYADPANDVYNPLRYIANNTLTGIATTFVLLVAISQTWMMWLFGGKFMLVLLIAEYTFSIGLASRFGLHANPESRGIYIVENLLVVLSPCGFIAANYILLGRLALWLGCDQHLLIPRRRITLIFVLSDVFTFLVQGSGGGISVSSDMNTVQLGSHIFLAGLTLQLVSFLLFFVVFSLFLRNIFHKDPVIWNKDAGEMWYNDWRALAGAMLVSCVGIIIRSIYRMIEMSQGYSGKIATTEAYFYAFDTLPLFIAILVYTPFWPGRFTPRVEGAQRINMDKVEMENLQLEAGGSSEYGRNRWAGGSR